VVVDREITVRIFDFDGTLFHLPVDVAAVRRDLGVAPDTKLGPLLQRFIDDGDQDSLALVTRHECAAARAGSLLPGARECLSAKGKLAIVTRNSRQAVLAALGGLATGLPVVGREDVRRLKPDPEGVRLALERLGAGARQSILIGDTYHDVEAAHAAGVRCVVVRNSRLAYAPGGADHYVDELSGIPGWAESSQVS
jgi:HAD superfamily hydrolase (TIGR01509 family)